MALSLNGLPERVVEWNGALAQQTYLWQQGVWVAGQLPAAEGRLVLLAEQLGKQALSHSLQVLDEAGIEAELSAVHTVAGRELASLRLSAWSPALKTALQQVAIDWDLACVPALPEAGRPGLVLMDMDSTAIQIECIDEIAALAGVGEEVAAVTRAAMEGALPFSESLRRRVAALTGADAAIIEEVIGRMPLMPGLTELVAGLKAMGWKVAIASGGFVPFARHLQEQLGLDAVFANTLGIEHGRLTGEVLGAIVDADAKANILAELAHEHGIPLAQTVAIGDGANDLKMLARAGLGVALHAKPLVQEQAPVCLNRLSLEGVLGLLQAR
ncbi:phosphoserine phosphatase [Oceanimonas sp. GK1]|uniref:phosphoserine phosphatase SerB n=1 Tax=Oceanimonas sp. (strain GK1 / IBRC-M 10197) TaxID=511062 RepID=UPI0002494F40|nr:phosphoserine phosphatase SerB [Oceanimonas sp. GK1]AEY00769.1 phosphoserine phosphatase [Oceanimonas sp. GK1]